jgi:hypothetical protein
MTEFVVLRLESQCAAWKTALLLCSAHITHDVHCNGEYHEQLNLLLIIGTRNALSLC